MILRRRGNRPWWALVAAAVAVLLVWGVARGWPGRNTPLEPVATTGGAAETEGIAGNLATDGTGEEDSSGLPRASELLSQDLLPESADGRGVDELLADTGLADVLAASERREVMLGVQEAAAQEVERYRGLGTALLVRAGWLDLVGHSWGCVVSGPGWVDVCVVTRVDEDASQVSVARMEVEEWRRAYGEQAG